MRWKGAIEYVAKCRHMSPKGWRTLSRLTWRDSGLVKAFGAAQAVDGADLQVETGSSYGAIGSNGTSGSNSADKTTLPNVSTTKGRRTPLSMFSALDAMRG